MTAITKTTVATPSIANMTVSEIESLYSPTPAITNREAERERDVEEERDDNAPYNRSTSWEK